VILFSGIASAAFTKSRSPRVHTGRGRNKRTACDTYEDALRS